MKKKLTEDTKSKLIYSGELLFFSIVFCVVGILEITCVITLLKKHPNWFYIITSLGVVLGILDLLFFVIKKDRREKKSLLDKLLLLPNLIFLLIFNLIHFINGNDIIELRYAISILFLYNSLSYLIQGIYHYFKPIPGLIEDKTENLIIRRFRKYDLENNKILLNYDNDADAKKDLEIKLYSTDFYVIETKKDHRFLGQIFFTDDGKTAQFSFNFFKNDSNDDFILESLSFLIKEAFKGKIEKVESNINSKNFDGIKILEKLNLKEIKREKEISYYELKK